MTEKPSIYCKWFECDMPGGQHADDCSGSHMEVIGNSVDVDLPYVERHAILTDDDLAWARDQLRGAR